jgi:uncharacterized membrane protein YjfL (UPF0719 family)
MDALKELIKHTPEILKAASASDLSLAAFFFLLGVVLVIVLMRSAPTAWKMLAIVIWFAASLLTLLYFVHQKMPEPDFVVRIIGENTAVKGRVVDLDLGFIEADVQHQYSLNAAPDGGTSALEVLAADPPVTAKILHASDNAVSAVAEGQTLTLSLTSPETHGRKTSIVKIGKVGSKKDGLTVRVFFDALLASVSKHADSGPRSSGNGQDTSVNYPLCVDAPTEGDYRFDVDSRRYSLTGDRKCNEWSQCAAAPGTGPKQACFVFNMQGHSECQRAFSNCDATRNSEGHIDSTFRLTPSTPQLTSAAQ